ncbi:MAG TPA: hypothetical protein VHO90_00365, partial [Bacteroidales bacterium]|nr:hypothetical protein [Bacteroidales bacterium]
KLAYYKNQLADVVTEKVDLAANVLAKELNELKALVIYSPSEIDEERYLVENETDFNSTLEELKKAAKFMPNTSADLDAEYTENNERLNGVLIELEQVVKYKPGNSIAPQPEESDFEEVLAELSKTVKYSPEPSV